MAEEDYEIYAKFIADTKEFENGVKRIISETNKANKSTLNFKKILSSIGLASGGMALVTKSIKATTQAFKECLQASDEYEKGQRVLQQTLKVTGAETWTNISSLNEMQTQLSHTTNYSTSEIQQLQTVLLGFKSIKGDVFDQTTNAILDMATVMGMDLTNATQAVAKALDDPIKGLGSLSRQGFAFTESQKEMIQNLIDTGEKAKAQQIILDELYSTYGGASQSALDSSTRLKNAVTDLKTEIGKSFSENMAPMQEFFTKLIQGWADAKKKKNEYEKAINTDEKTIEDWKTIIKKESSNLESKRAKYEQALKIINMTNNEIKKTTEYMQYTMYSDSGAPLEDFIQGQKEMIHNFEYEEIILDNHKHALMDLEEQERKRLEILEQEQKAQEEQERRAQEEKEDAEKIAKAKQTLLEMENANKEKFHELDVQRERQLAEMRKQELEDEANMQQARDKIGGAETLDEKIEATKEAIVVAKELGMETDELEKKLARLMTLKVIKTAVSTFGNLIKGVLNGFKTGVETAINVVKKGISTITNIVKEGINIVKKLIEFNPDEALETLLKIEDAILTFFVITLPQLPKFVESAFSSVLVLVNTLFNSLDFNKISETLGGMVDTLITYVPQISEKLIPLISNLLQTVMNVITEKSPDIINALGSIFFNILEQIPNILSSLITMVGTVLSNLGKYIADNQERLTTDLTNIIQSIIDGIKTFVENGGWRNILDAILAIQEAIEDVVAENLPEIVDVIIEMLPDLVETLKNSIVSASETLGKLAPPLIKAIVAIIGAILDVITSNEVIDASIEAIEGIVEALVSELLPKLPKFILKIINFILIKLPSYTPKLVVGIVKGLIKGFAETDWKQVVIDIFEAFVDGIKDFFGIHSPSTLFQELGGFMVEGLQIGLQGIADILGNVLSGFADVIEKLSSGIDGLMNISFDGLINSVNSIFDGLSKITSVSFDGLVNSVNSVFNGLSNITKLSFDGLSDLVHLSLDKTTENVNSIFNGLSNVTKLSFSGLVNGVNSVFNGLSKITSLSFNGLTSLANVSFNGINSSVSTLADVFVKVNDSITNTLITLKNFIKELGNLSPGGSADRPLWEKILDPLNLFATGVNNAPRGLAVVGEQGPELVDFKGGERVYTASNTKGILSGASGNSNTMNVTFNNLKDTTASAMMSQLRYYNRQLAIDGIL